jgi:hypothetical protein
MYVVNENHRWALVKTAQKKPPAQKTAAPPAWKQPAAAPKPPALKKPAAAPKPPALKKPAAAPKPPALKKPAAAKVQKIKVTHDQLYRVLKQVHPDTSINKDASVYTTELLHKVGTALVSRGVTNSASLQSLIKDGTDLTANMIRESKRAELVFTDNGANNNMLLQPMKLPPGQPKHIKASNIAGLVFDTGGTVTINASLEYLCAEMLELAGNVTRDYNRRRISVYDVKLAIASDKDFVKLFKFVGVNTGASTCMKFPAFPKTRKLPPFSAIQCYHTGDRRKMGQDGKMYTAQRYGSGYKWVVEK